MPAFALRVSTTIRLFSRFLLRLRSSAVPINHFFRYHFCQQQKWAKSKLREKKVNRVVFTKSIYESTMKSVPTKLKVITLYNLIETYKINGSLARKLVQQLLEVGSIKPIVTGGSLAVYASTKVWAE